MAGFTKGPWQVRRAKLADNTGGYDWAVSVDSKVIAEVFEHVDYADDGDGFEKFPAEANARAIAEVPAMFDALRLIDGDGPGNEPRDGPTVGFQPSSDPEIDDGNDVVLEAFNEGVARGQWLAAAHVRAIINRIEGGE